jgi:hypothetical protein
MPKGTPKTKGFPCLVVTFEDAETLNDTQKYITFVRGVGVLDRTVLEAKRPDWFQLHNDEKIAGLFLNFKRYWEDKGATVDVVDEETAAKVKVELENPKPAKPADPETLADMKDKAEAKIKGKGKPDADDKGGDDPLPHQK